jgi:hypothetical protein
MSREPPVERNRFPPGTAALHSRYDPRAEAERYIAALNPGSGIEYFILIEPGLGYLVPALQKKYPASKIIALHADPVFKPAGGEGTIPAWFPGDGPGIQQFLENEIPDVEAQYIRVIEWRPGLRVYGEKYLWLLSEAVDFIKRIDANKRTARGFGQRWIKNFFKNLGLLRVLLGPKPFAGPLVITGSGPGLEEALPIIQGLKNDGPLFTLAAASSVKALAQGGINPDLIISTDGGSWALLHLHECFRRWAAPPAPLAANLCAALPSQCSSLPIMVLNDGSLWQSLVFRTLGIPSIRIPQRGTVSASALDLALLLCGGNIFIAGMDLAARDIRTHARPYGFDPLFWGTASRFAPFYSRIFCRAGAINRGGSQGIYAAWFQRQLAGWPGRVYSMGNNNPVFQALNPWDHPGRGLCTRREERFPAGEFFGAPAAVPAGINAGRGAAILAEALTTAPAAEALAAELAPLLFPNEKNVSAGALAEEIRAIARPYSGGSDG